VRVNPFRRSIATTANRAVQSLAVVAGESAERPLHDSGKPAIALYITR
jgi:hypothetical protein